MQAATLGGPNSLFGLSGPQGVLESKDFENFYQTFITSFKSVEMQINQGPGVGDVDEQTPNDLKMNEILAIFEKTPSLGCIFPHVLQFMQHEIVRLSTPLIDYLGLSDKIKEAFGHDAGAHPQGLEGYLVQPAL